MKGNILGDIRAENDTKMLESAYYESSDYKALVESYDRPIVVGRRGTGKSALAFKLQRHWGAKPRTITLSIAPDEEQIIGLRETYLIFLVIIICISRQEPRWLGATLCTWKLLLIWLITTNLKVT